MPPDIVLPQNVRYPTDTPQTAKLDVYIPANAQTKMGEEGTTLETLLTPMNDRAPTFTDIPRLRPSDNRVVQLQDRITLVKNPEIKLDKYHIPKELENPTTPWYQSKMKLIDAASVDNHQ